MESGIQPLESGIQPLETFSVKTSISGPLKVSLFVNVKHGGVVVFDPQYATAHTSFVEGDHFDIHCIVFVSDL